MSGYFARAKHTILLLALFVFAFAPPSFAAEKRHGLSAFGDLKYPANFKHFDYVNPNAPKGGTLSMIGTAGRITFDSFNGYILKGNPAQGLGYLTEIDLIFDTLMVRARDEPDAVYGLVAKSAIVADDKKSVRFEMRPEARFADGSKLTAHDAVASFNLIKKHGHPIYLTLLRDVVKAEALSDYEIRYEFKGENLRDLPLLVAQLPLFSKAYYEKEDFSKSSLKPPLGSGPYKITKFKQGTFVIFERRKDYWGAHLPVNKGRLNFDVLRYEYYRDRTTEFEALKAGAYDLREEFTSRDWATAYKIPQVTSGRLKRLTLSDNRPSGAQGFFINMRREKFSDLRVRKALNLAFDFEWTNKNLFHNLYKRTASFFENSDMKASGAASEAELALLEPFRAKLPAHIFTKPDLPPVTDGKGLIRNNLRRASKLLREAGWTIKDGKRVNAAGQHFTLEILTFSPSFERIIAPYIRNLATLGIKGSIRRVDPAQYELRLKNFDFDMTTERYSLSTTPGPELKSYWGSQAAKTAGSRNLSGINNPVVDALIDKVVQAKTRAEMHIAARALDRVLRAGHYWVPQWYKAAHNIAHWDKFSWPKTKPRYQRGVIETWWFDETKANALKNK